MSDLQMAAAGPIVGEIELSFGVIAREQRPQITAEADGRDSRDKET